MECYEILHVTNVSFDTANINAKYFRHSLFYGEPLELQVLAQYGHGNFSTCSSWERALKHRNITV